MPVPFADAMTAAPIGVAMLAGLEAQYVTPKPRRVPPGPGKVEGDPRAVEQAVEYVATSMTFAEVIELASQAGAGTVGPWSGDWSAWFDATVASNGARRPIAEAFADRFERELHLPMDRWRQQWWTTDAPPGPRSRAAVHRFRPRL